MKLRPFFASLLIEMLTERSLFLFAAFLKNFYASTFGEWGDGLDSWVMRRWNVLQNKKGLA